MNKETLILNLKLLNIEISPLKLEQLDMYYNLLLSENNLYNLTAITRKEDVYLKHFYDSATISKIIELKDQTICDIGSGAGFPGLVLKILYPKLNITLLESNQKKCNFLYKVIEKLQLKGIWVINNRAEIFAKDNREKYDIVTARAVAPLKHLLEYSVPLIKENGYFIAMKGLLKETEIKNINNYYNKLNIILENKIEFLLPIENSSRTLLKYKKTKKTSSKYPRKYSEIKNKEL